MRANRGRGPLLHWSLPPACGLGVSVSAVVLPICPQNQVSETLSPWPGLALSEAKVTRRLK